MNRQIYRNELDRALLFAAKHTDSSGRMIVEGEIDTKDSGWLVLGGIIRGMEEGWSIGHADLKDLCRRWTLASVRVDDVKSAWTTFALLLSLEFAGEKFRTLFSESEWSEIAHFFRQIDMSYLLAASRNYRVAAAVIDLLRIRHGFCETHSVDPSECVEFMLAGYLGNGFFNDDDGRGDSRDKRIDAYSAEIIGLLLHYDEIHQWNSPFHDRIFRILKEFCDSNLALIDVDGEYAKWGRSLRGEAEVKKIFLWEFAQTRNLTTSGDAAAQHLFRFFLKTGIRADGKIGRDKAFDSGIWDEYTTHVQAQGYGIYGLAMALRFASGEHAAESSVLPSESEDYVRILPGPAILCANDHRTGVHYILPAGNRITKNMFFWHNRITQENDVEVDVSIKFMPLPYFGHLLPTPYTGVVIPFLPILQAENGNRLVPRNLDPQFSLRGNTVEQVFHYCRPKEYSQACDLCFRSRMVCHPGRLEFSFDFEGRPPEDSEIRIHLCEPTVRSLKRVVQFSRPPIREIDTLLAPSVYQSETKVRAYCFRPDAPLNYSFALKIS